VKVERRWKQTEPKVEVEVGISHARTTAQEQQRRHSTVMHFEHILFPAITTPERAKLHFHTYKMIQSRRPHRSLGSNPLSDRAVGHVLLPFRRDLGVCWKVGVRVEALGQVVRHLVQRELSSDVWTVEGIDDVARDEVEEDQVDSGWHRPIERERSVGLEIVGLRVVWDFRVNGVIAVRTKVILCDVPWGGSSGLTADETTSLLGAASKAFVVVCNGRVNASVAIGKYSVEVEVGCLEVSLLLEGTGVQDTNDLLSLVIRHIGDVLEGVVERRHDKGVIVGERSLRKVETNATGVNDDESRDI
jgi:hypothetical protein